MNQELKNDLVATYNEVKEVLTNFNQLTDEELIEVKEAMRLRLTCALHWLGKYVSDEDIIEIYLDWVNNFISLDKFADHYGLDEMDAHYIIDLGRTLNNK